MNVLVPNKINGHDNDINEIKNALSKSIILVGKDSKEYCIK